MKQKINDKEISPAMNNYRPMKQNISDECTIREIKLGNRKQETDITTEWQYIPTDESNRNTESKKQTVNGYRVTLMVNKSSTIGK
ncbi:hypothetical protein CHS0354_004315 [Potamilus streckersoni]|uniref:Uncharacterized protein n=1 Tax=Potamilus streckersoni TaxID=2493646 RepID=A0AAE0VV93_9BIVA|nr:hypothetical protein CHS0354_004315 [Potamilus streckersoni]